MLVFQYKDAVNTIMGSQHNHDSKKKGHFTLTKDQFEWRRFTYIYSTVVPVLGPDEF